MEVYDISRSFLGCVFLLNVFLLYGVSQGVFRGSFNKKLVNGLFITKFILLTGFIVYDNICSPPRDGWVLAIIGYALVYFIIFMVWLSIQPNCALKADTCYDMKLQEYSSFDCINCILGTVSIGKKEVWVFLPYKEDDKKYFRLDASVKVKFKKVYKGGIFVTLA